MGIFSRKAPAESGLESMTVTELRESAHPQNPRRITQDQLDRLRSSVEKYGDLSGIVYNRRTGHVVCGHQRLKIMDAEHTSFQFSSESEEPDDTGSVATGWIIDSAGEVTHHPYRVVDVDDQTEHEMMIAANAHGGDWQADVLRHQLATLAAADVDMGAVGFADEELARLLKRAADEAPGEFKDAEPEALGVTEYQCPSCSHEWNGKPR